MALPHSLHSWLTLITQWIPSGESCSSGLSSVHPPSPSICLWQRLTGCLPNRLILLGNIARLHLPPSLAVRLISKKIHLFSSLGTCSGSGMLERAYDRLRDVWSVFPFSWLSHLEGIIFQLTLKNGLWKTRWRDMSLDGKERQYHIDLQNLTRSSLIGWTGIRVIVRHCHHLEVMLACSLPQGSNNRSTCPWKAHPRETQLPVVPVCECWTSYCSAETY